jgi:hypothetical protein
VAKQPNATANHASSRSKCVSLICVSTVQVVDGQWRIHAVHR